MRTPLNRPMVLRLAGMNATRVIPAGLVSELEQVATTTLSAAERGFVHGHIEAVEKLRAYFDGLEAARESMNQDLVNLVSEAVEKIVRGLPQDVVTRGLIETALDEAQDALGRLVLRVHPVRGDEAERWLREQSAIEDGSRRVIVEVDATMGMDECVLETPAGRIDAGLQTQLEALKALFRQPALRAEHRASA